jgi:hypothetical protein
MLSSAPQVGVINYVTIWKAVLAIAAVLCTYRAMSVACRSMKGTGFRIGVAMLSGCVLLSILSSYLSDWPLQLRFQFSKNSLDSFVRKLDNGQNPDIGENKWVGLYNIKAVRVEESTLGRVIYFATMQDELLGTQGLAYSCRRVLDVSNRLSGNWYVFGHDP